MNPRARKLGHKVKPRTTAGIEIIASSLRDNLGIEAAKVKIVKLIEMLQDIGSLTLDIVEDWELKDVEAVAFPDKNIIRVKNSIYEAACRGIGHAVFTLAHELGHIIMHKKQEPSYARGNHKIYEDSEWQADTFASAFLMDARFINLQTDSAYEISIRFGTSFEAANVRLDKLKR